MKIKKLSIFILVLTLELFIISFSNASTKKLKVVVEPINNEVDTEDNTRETVVNVISQGNTDLAVTNMSISPITLTEPTIVSIFVIVKNKGNNIANNVNVYLSCLGRKKTGEYVSVVIGTYTISEISASEENRAEFKPELCVKNGIKNYETN